MEIFREMEWGFSWMAAWIERWQQQAAGDGQRLRLSVGATGAGEGGGGPQRRAEVAAPGGEPQRQAEAVSYEDRRRRQVVGDEQWRQKAQKDLAVCGHDILAARRDSAAFSTRTSYHASGPGASSESATTSVNNHSHSGTMQRLDDVTVRLDDVTVDSTISRKHTVRFSLHNRDTDRNTADSSTSTISYKRKLDDWESLADKNLPERPATASQKPEDGETKSTDKTNQCPPKRYVYTRRSSMPKKKQWSQDVVEGPGG